MRKVILMLLLAVVSNSAIAEWIGVGSSDGIDIYVDKTTIRKNGSMVKMWSLNDYKTVHKDAYFSEGNAYLSIASQGEYDCKGEQARLLSFASYSKNMGYGNAVYSHTDNYIWEPFVPESITEALWKFACGIK